MLADSIKPFVNMSLTEEKPYEKIIDRWALGTDRLEDNDMLAAALDKV